MGSQSIDPSPVGEEQQVRMRSREDDVLHDVIGLELRSGDALATTTLALEVRSQHSLDVLSLGHHNHKLGVINEVFDAHFA